jgi:hypothetical protein
MNRRAFFKYFTYVFYFGVIGTIVTFSIIAPLTYIANSKKMFYYSYIDGIEEVEAHNRNEEINNNLTHGNFNITNPLHVKSHLIPNSFMAVSDKPNDSSLVIPPDSEEKLLNKYNQISFNNSTSNSSNSSGRIVNNNHQYLLELSVKEILLFSAVISASDSVAALAFINEKTDPKLFSILFGEGVINDAVCIVIYKIVKDFIDSGAGILFNYK